MIYLNLHQDLQRKSDPINTDEVTRELDDVRDKLNGQVINDGIMTEEE